MTLACLIGAASAGLALLALALLHLLRQVVKGCAPHPIQSEWDTHGLSAEAAAPAETRETGSRNPHPYSRDGLLVGAGLFSSIALGLGNPAWLAGALVLGLYLVLTGLKQ